MADNNDYKKPIPWLDIFVQDNFPFIAQDFDSLTLYEKYQKIVKYLMEVVKKANLTSDEVVKLTDLINSIKDYVNNYFDNLDVQDEINKKLDEMKEDGTLEDIINAEITKAIFFEENSDIKIDTTFLAYDIEIQETDDSLIYITKIPKKNIEKISVIPTNMNYSDPYTNEGSIQSLALINDKYDIYINSGLMGVNIMDGITFDMDMHSYYYICFNSANAMFFEEGQETRPTSQDLLDKGYINVCPVFVPLLQNKIVFDYDDYASRHTNLKGNHDKLPRQILADDKDNYYVFSVIGRRGTFIGMTYPELVNLVQSKNVDNAIVLDGGGSTQETIKKHMLYPSQDPYAEPIGRLVPTAIGFKLKGV